MDRHEVSELAREVCLRELGNAQQLTGAQRWEVSKLIAGALSIGVVLLGFLGWQSFSTATTSIAQSIDEEEIAKVLATDDEYTETLSQLIAAIPAGAVMAFNLDSCPAGWTRLSLLEGRFIIGASEKYEFGEQGGRLDIPAGGAHSHKAREVQSSSQRFGNDNDDDHFWTTEDGEHNHGGNNLPPYLALTYCEKQ